MLPSEPADFHPTCPPPSPTLAAFLKTLPPGVRPGVEGNASIRAALGPREHVRTASADDEDEKVRQTQIERRDALDRERRAAVELARSEAGMAIVAVLKRAVMTSLAIRKWEEEAAEEKLAADVRNQKSATDTIAAAAVRHLHRRTHLLTVSERKESGVVMSTVVRRALALRRHTASVGAASVLAAAAIRVAARRSTAALWQRQAQLAAAAVQLSAGVSPPTNAAVRIKLGPSAKRVAELVGIAAATGPTHTIRAGSPDPPSSSTPIPPPPRCCRRRPVPAAVDRGAQPRSGARRGAAALRTLPRGACTAACPARARRSRRSRRQRGQRGAGSAPRGDCERSCGARP